ncbi:HipA domain-containing protein [Hymenobacter rubripertinctus]|uniref:Type II toxin-antitoxin system HipA family toxin n=1 Tax=Hymenobacter rubripertinctus TaxID=2029981 RepID=A0A418QMI5_9BACT|nr:HipA domain-containing protein [Hymenobacter rubripertinctus]RIY06354.1 type II toxin-antitoxin system HipA family toxin [Hymenobacter rubripertinctus]
MSRCLFCYQPLPGDEGVPAYHPACSRKLFGKVRPPAFPYSQAQLLELAEAVVRQHITVTGVQPKLSLSVAPADAQRPGGRFTIVGALAGEYILKPPTARYPHLPEVEDLTMHLAALAGLATVPHGLLRLEGEALAYVTRRVDRVKGRKRAMEDMCQLTGRLTENKYDGSHEQVAKALLQHSANPGLDVVNFYEVVLFSFLTGNADMHLKNFSLLHTPGLGYGLAPAYDLVATALINPADTEELALTLNGRKRRLRQSDFRQAAGRGGVDEKVVTSMFARFAKAKPIWHEFIDQSFLPAALQQQFHLLLDQRFAQWQLA